MPDPVLYLWAMSVAAVASALCVLACGGWRRPASAWHLASGGLLALAVGLLLGYHQLRFHWTWPPVNALGRLLLIVLPATLAVELVAGHPRCRAWFAWCLRFGLSAAVTRILLHDSVYLTPSSDPARGWSVWQMASVLILSGCLLGGQWYVLVGMSRRTVGASGRASAAVSVPLALAMAALSAGACIMLAGYVTGGAAALPFSAALVGTSLALCWIAGGTRLEGPVSVGVVGLFGLLIVGRFFGAISTAQTLVILLAPFLCGAGELPPFKRLSARWSEVVRLFLVALPLLVVLFLARREFNQRMRPLVRHSPPRHEVLECRSAIQADAPC